MKKRKPCNLCPFLKTALPGWLGERRAADIVQSSLTDSTFHCHKTLTASHNVGKNTRPCAGSVLLHVKEGRGNRYYRYIDHEYEGGELVQDSAQDFINHHKNPLRR